MIQMLPEWLYPTVPLGHVSRDAIDAFLELAIKMSSADQAVLEIFKDEYRSMCGEGSVHSSNYDWAKTDLRCAMESLENNRPLFVGAFCNAVEKVSRLGKSVPNVDYINGYLDRFGMGYRIDGNGLVETHLDVIRDESDESAFGYGKETAEMASVYEIKKPPIGSGGFGTVYRATRKSSLESFEFALKLFDPSSFVSDRPKALERFKREISVLKRLQHRALISYIDAGIDREGNFFLVMPLVDGERLDAAAGRCNYKDRVGMVCEVLRGVGYAHCNDVLHRDLKPSNILVRKSDMQPIIVDFGLAYLFDDLGADTLTTSGLGSIGYIPSEVIADPKARSFKHDIYSCGVILYEILSGRRPDPMNICSLQKVDDRLSVLDHVVGRALASVNSRYESVDEFLADLTAVYSEMDY